MKNLIILILLTTLLGCVGTHQSSQSKSDSLLKDSLERKKSDSIMAMGDRPDDEQEGPTFAEVKADLFASYKRIIHIDTIIIDGADTMQVHFKYYCLHDSVLIIPKHYLWGGDTSKDFTTHNFAAKIIIINNKDTVLSKTFTKTDFNHVLYSTLQKYATIVEASFEGFNTRLKGEFLFGFSISVPLTDVGIPAYIQVDKKGNCKILDEYADKYFSK